MKEHPILFSGAMVRALLAGTKTQTRRVVKTEITMGRDSILAPHRGKKRAPVYLLPELAADAVSCCPYGQTGDRLWVRESWQYYDWTDDGLPCVRFAADNGTAWTKLIPQEQADRLTDIWAGLSSPENYQIDNRARDRRWRPSIHMPRWASRITLEVTGVRVERLQDISEADALAEGIVPHVRGGWHWHPHNPSDLDDWHQFGFKTAAYAYESLWGQINGPGSWATNPWVWVLEFRRLNAKGGAA